MLTTIATVQALPGIPAGWTPEQIQAGINAASAMIEKYCDRTFAAADYKEWVDGTGRSSLLLHQYPLIMVRRVSTQVDWCLDLTNDSAGMSAYSISVADGKLNLTIVGGANAGTSTLTLSTYASMALLAAAIEALGKGWHVVVENEGDPATIRPGFDGASLTTTQQLRLFIPGVEYMGYIPRIDQGIIQAVGVWPSGQGSVYVDYRAGYEAIPDDLSVCCAALAVDILLNSTSNGTVIREKVGNVETQYSDTTRNGGGLINNYLQILQPYKRLTL